MGIPEDMLRNLYENMMDAFAGVDLEGRITTCNDIFCAMVGYSREELLTMTYQDLTPEKWLPLEADILRDQVLSRGYSDIYQKEYRHKNGTVFPVELRVCLHRDSEGTHGCMWAIVRDISERKRMEEALRASEERYRAVVEDQTEVISRFLADGTCTFVNDVYCRFFGKEREELIGSKWQPQALAEDVPMIERELCKLTQDNPVVFIENRVLSGLGHVHWMQFVNRGFFDRNGEITEIQSVGRDITERRRAEQHLALMSLALDMVHDEAYLIDEKASLHYANEESCRTLGYSRDEMMGLTVSDIDPCSVPHEWPERWRSLAGSGVLAYESRHRRKDGREYPVDVSSSYFEYEGRGYELRLARDITERRKVEEERLDIERRLQHARKMESIGVLVGGIAHDFNNLLSVILGNLELALMDLPAESPIRDRLVKAEIVSERAAHLIRQMLAYAGKGLLMKEPTDLNRVLRGNEELLRAAVTGNTVLTFRPAASLPQVQADREQILQVAVNLISNAAEAMDGTPGIITLRTGSAECDQDILELSRIDEKPQPGRFVYLEVADDGCGMDEETQQRLFDPFFTTKFLGRGLGMSAVLGIVRAHHGAILMNSAPGKGTTVRVLLPVLNHTAPPPRAQYG